MSETSPAVSGSRPFLQTERKDNWWLEPFAIAFGLFAFGVYAFWAAIQGDHYQWGPYISPFYSPLIKTDGMTFSPAFFIVWAPLGFRATCYYFRRAYYRSLFLTPPACSVGAMPQRYRGERALFIFQNLHRYFLYLALVLVAFHIHDTFKAFSFQDGFGVGMGSVVITLDTLFLSFFVLGCNSLRHLVGGNSNCFSCETLGGPRHGMWRIVSIFNRHHKEWAWISMIWVGVADLYVRLVSMGIITDMRIF